MLIDWLTLRCSERLLPVHFLEKLQSALGQVIKFDSQGELVYRKAFLDFDSIRSDEDGLFITRQGDGKDYYFVIAASPASLEHTTNVFGSLDIAHCAKTLINHASRIYDVAFPHFHNWQCRRADITANYSLPSAEFVKEALRLLRGTDAARRKAQSPKKGGDTVYWNMTSDRRKGKAYHKGPHLEYLKRKNSLPVTNEEIDLSSRLLRLELQLGARWFREDLPKLAKQWHQLNTNDLITEHQNYFNAIIGKDLGASDMTDFIETIKKSYIDVKGVPTLVSPGQAASAHSTWLSIKEYGFEQVKERMSKVTFWRHVKILEAAGLSRADLCAGKLTPVRRAYLTLSQPVWSWEHLRLMVSESANDASNQVQKVA